MKNVLSKTLLCGVLATSFLLINCQKAPNRPVKSGTPDANAKQAAVLTECKDNMLASITERRTLIDDLKKLDAEDKAIKGRAAPADRDKVGLDDKQKEEVQKIITSLGEKTSQLEALFKTAKVAGCTVKDAKDPKAAAKEHKLEDMKAENMTAAQVAKKLTGRSNSIIDDANAGISTGKSLKLSAEMAALLSDEKNLNGAKSISEGKIADGNSLIGDKTKSSCAVTLIDKAEVKADSVAKVGDISSAKDAKSNRDIVTVSLAIKAEAGDRLMQLSCALAEGSDVKKELEKTLGALASIVKEGEAPAAPAAPVEPPKADPAAPPKADPAAPPKADPAAPPKADPAAPPKADPAAPPKADPAAPEAGADAAAALQIVNSRLGNK